MRELKDGIRSKVTLDFQGRVHKWFRGTDADKRYANEIAVLKVLEERGCPYVPQLLEEHPDDLYFVSTNCGGPANSISKAKSDALFAELERDYAVRHDDAEPRNVTYNAKSGPLRLPRARFYSIPSTSFSRFPTAWVAMPLASSPPGSSSHGSVAMPLSSMPSRKMTT